MPFRSSLADIELQPFVFHSRTPRDRAVRPSEHPTTRITARGRDENRLEIKFLREAMESWLARSPLTWIYAEADISFHPNSGAAPRNLSLGRSVDLDGLTRDPGDLGPGDLVRERLDIQRVLHCSP